MSRVIVCHRPVNNHRQCLYRVLYEIVLYPKMSQLMSRR